MPTIQINYKSGHKEVFEVNEFTFDYISKSANWRTSVNSKQKPLWLNVEEIESIWQLF